MELDSTQHARAKHAAYVRLARIQESARLGDATRALAAHTPRQGKRAMTCDPEIQTALEALAARKERLADDMREARKFAGSDLVSWPLWHVTAHASAQGWQALYAARLVRENPARTSYTQEELRARLRGEARELA